MGLDCTLLLTHEAAEGYPPDYMDKIGVGTFLATRLDLQRSIVAAAAYLQAIEPEHRVILWWH